MMGWGGVYGSFVEVLEVCDINDFISLHATVANFFDIRNNIHAYISPFAAELMPYTHSHYLTIKALEPWMSSGQKPVFYIAIDIICIVSEVLEPRVLFTQQLRPSLPPFSVIQ